MYLQYFDLKNKPVLSKIQLGLLLEPKKSLQFGLKGIVQQTRNEVELDAYCFLREHKGEMIACDGTS